MAVPAVLLSASLYSVSALEFQLFAAQYPARQCPCQRFAGSFRYQAGSWIKPRRVVAKVEWHPGELYPRVGFIVTNMTRPAERVVMFYNHRGTAEQ